MNKLTYVEATIEIVPLVENDVITTSGFNGPDQNFFEW